MSNNIGHNTNNIKTYTRGVGQQHTSSSVAKRTPNKYDLNGYKAYKFGNMRAALNKNGSIFNARGGVIVNQGGGTSNKAANIMNGVMAGLMVGKTVANIFASSKNVVNSFDGKGGVESNNTSVDPTTLTGKLSSASSFSEINSLKEQAATQKQNLNKDYKNLDIKETVASVLEKTDVAEGLSLVGVTLSIDKLQLSELAPDNLENSIKTIDADIGKIKGFQSDDIEPAGVTLSKKKGELEGEISANKQELSQMKSTDAEYSKLENCIKQLEENLKNVKIAQDALKNVNEQCKKNINDLGGEKTEISRLKEFEEKLTDKEYNLAKSQDKQLKETMQKIDKLTNEIKSLEGKTDQKQSQKCDSLRKERSGLYDTLGTLIESLSAAGKTEFVDGNGSNKIDIKGDLDKALNYGKGSSTSSTSTATAATGGGATSEGATTKITSIADLANVKVGETIEIDGNTYTKGDDNTFKMTSAVLNASFSEDEMISIYNGAKPEYLLILR